MSESIVRKPITGLALLAGAAGGPYMLCETDIGATALKLFSGEQTSAEVSPAPAGTFTATSSPSAPQPRAPWDIPQTDPSHHILNKPHSVLDHAPVMALSEVLRFDVTPGWVTNRFPRVSTIVGTDRLDGMRVPLVTGTTPSDMAGTLTYYFDSYQRLQRISLQSVTGDPNRFIGELQTAYKLEQQPALGGNLYLLTWNGTETSVLRVAPAAIIRADAPYARFDVFLELNQPGLQYGLSADARGLLDAGRAARRW